jgi:opacity protein-like surface antigen
MQRKALLLAAVVMVGLAAFAQEFPRAEVGVMYSYSRFTPSTHYAPNLNLNGGGGEVAFNVNSWLGIKAELMGSGASKATFTIPSGDPIAPRGANVQVSGNLFTYLFGPRIRVPLGRFHPYLHALFGGAHSSVFANAESACSGICQPIAPTTASSKPSQNAFGMALGGGLDIPVGHVVGIRVAQVDYLMTRFTNRFATNNQNNFRYSAGVVFNFGH